MKLDMLKRNIGQRVQLEPPAIHLDRFGRELPCLNVDWIIASVTDTVVRLDEANQMGLTTTVGTDAVHHYTSNPARSTLGGPTFGLLLLAVQMFIQTGKILYRPCARPGERVAPLPPRLERTLVDNDFLRISGTQAHLEADGWRTSWCRESRLPTLERQGWELVVVSGAGGVPTSLYRSGIPEAQVYIKSRGRDLQMLANHPYFRQSAGIRGYSVDDAAHTISFHFDGPANAGAFIHRTNRHPNGLRCKWGAGRVDVVVVDVPRESTP